MNITDLSLITLTITPPGGKAVAACVAVKDINALFTHADIREPFSDELFMNVANQLERRSKA